MPNDVFIEQALHDARSDATIVELRQLAINYEKWYNAGLIDAARKADSWGEESGGGSGTGGEGYKNLANSIRDMQRKI